MVSLSLYFPANQQMTGQFMVYMGISSNYNSELRHIIIFLLIMYFCHRCSVRNPQRRLLAPDRGPGFFERLFLRRHVRHHPDYRPIDWCYLCKAIKRRANARKIEKEQRRLFSQIVSEKEFIAGGADFGQDSCVICIEKFANREKVCALQCQHLFHRRCIANWLKDKDKPNMNCPVCNKNILELAGGDLELVFLQQNLERVEQADPHQHRRATEVSQTV